MANTPTPCVPSPRPVSGQPAELLEQLRRAPNGLTRVEALDRRRPALALNMPKLITQLCRAGYPIERRWEWGRDAHGHSTRFRRYCLS